RACGRPSTHGAALAEKRARLSGVPGFWGYNVYRQIPNTTPGAPAGSTTYGPVGQVGEAGNPTAATPYTFTDPGFTPGGPPESDSVFPSASNPGIGCNNGGWLPAST